MFRTAIFIVLITGFSLEACLQSNTDQHQQKATEESADAFVDASGDSIFMIRKSEKEWMEQLDPQAYNVLREKGTERPFTGEYNKFKKEGVYMCRACKLSLFSSDAKFNSGTGWPSFFQPIDETHVLEVTDSSHGMKRVEVLCRRCGGHLGHVFEDGPKPTGLRYCMNSVSLSFEPSDNANTESVNEE